LIHTLRITFIHRFSNRSLRYMDGYHYGLNGHEVAWAVKKYSGHCGLPCEAVHEVAQEFSANKT